MSIEICIVNPYGTLKSNEKLKKCALKAIDENSNIYINEENIIDDYFSHHLETISVSSLVKQIPVNPLIIIDLFNATRSSQPHLLSLPVVAPNS